MIQGGLEIRIAFVTDGGKEMGMGHVMRSLTIAEEIAGSADVFFITSSDVSVQEGIASKGFRVEYVDNDNQLVKMISRIQVDTVVIDRPPVKEKLIKRIRESSKVRIVVFDSDTYANRWADVAVNALLNSEFQNKRYQDEETSTLYFYGSKYIVLRAQFKEYSKEPAIEPENASRILVIFGGSDPANLTSKTLRGLLSLQDRRFQIVVLMGPKFAHRKEVDRTIKEYGAQDSVELIQNSEQVAELMWRSDLVFVSPGLSLFEALSVGSDVIAASQNELQRTVYRHFFEEFDKTPEPFRFFDESFFLSPKERKVKEMEIGKGRAEVIEAIIKPG